MAKLPVEARVEVTVGKKSVDKLIDAVVDAFSPATETLGALGDAVRLGRVEIAARITRNAKEIADANGLILTAPPLKFLAPFYEQASIEDEGASEIEEMWANLLVSASANYESVKSSYVKILGSLSRDEALLMKALFSASSYGQKDALSALEIADYIDPRTRQIGVEEFFEKPDCLQDVVAEHLDIPGNLLWFAGDSSGCDETFGVYLGRSRFHLPESIQSVEYLLDIVLLLVSKSLLREWEYTRDAGDATYEVLLYAATPLAISFMNEVQPGEQ